MNATAKKFAIVPVAVGLASAALFAGAGTASAASPSASYINNGLGTVARISDPANPPGAVETCTYRSHVAGNPLLFPYFSPVVLSGPTPSDLQIFGIQTGTAYQVTISCPVGGTTSFTKNY